MKFIDQVKLHAVALISLTIAITALLYNTWRDETSERNRNYRLAAFEVLKNLGELQIALNYQHYQPDNPMANSFVAWGYVAMVGDLSHLLPAPVPERVQQLLKVWKADWTKTKTDEAALDRITTELDASRQAVLDVIYKLR